MKKNNRILTVANGLSLFRVLLVPLFIYFYHFRGMEVASIVVLVICFITDILDGPIARTMHQVSRIGKILDPVADKIIQGALMICLVLHFRILLLPLIVFVLKEAANAYVQWKVTHETGEVHGAELHGKIATWILDGVILIHVLWYNIPFALSLILSILCVFAMLGSLAIYMQENWDLLRGEPVPPKEYEEPEDPEDEE